VERPRHEVVPAAREGAHAVDDVGLLAAEHERGQVAVPRAAGLARPQTPAELVADEDDVELPLLDQVVSPSSASTTSKPSWRRCRSRNRRVTGSGSARRAAFCMRPKLAPEEAGGSPSTITTRGTIAALMEPERCRLRSPQNWPISREKPLETVNAFRWAPPRLRLPFARDQLGVPVLRGPRRRRPAPSKPDLDLRRDWVAWDAPGKEQPRAPHTRAREARMPKPVEKRETKLTLRRRREELSRLGIAFVENGSGSYYALADLVTATQQLPSN
jgi:hypothetical protein